MSVEELIQAFEQSNKKADDIRGLATKFNITEREVIETLKGFNIKNIPKIISRSEVIDFSNGNIEKVRNRIKLDDDVTPAISVIRKFEQMGWNKKEGIERTIQLSYYIETKLGLDCFGIYTSVLEYIIQNSGVKGLEQDIESIQNGKGFNKTTASGLTEKVLNVFSKVAEGIVDNLADELSDEPETKLRKRVDEKPLVAKVYEAYSMLKNPKMTTEMIKMKHRFNKWRKEKVEKERLYQEGIKGVFDNE